MIDWIDGVETYPALKVESNLFTFLLGDYDICRLNLHLKLPADE